MDNLIKNLNDDLIKTINLLLDNHPDIIFGGSIVFNALGLIDRQVNDIDLFLPKNTSLSKNGFLSTINKLDSSEILSDTVTDINGNSIQRTGIKIHGVKCCVFKVDNNELENYSEYNFNGKRMLLQNVNYAITAKRIYSNKNDKHKKDLFSVNQVLNDLLNY